MVAVEKMIQGGYELARVEMPSLVTVSSEVGELRYPTVKRRLQALKQPIEVWSAEDVEIDSEKLKTIEIMELLPALGMGRQCHFMEGDSPGKKGENLAIALKGIV